MEYRTQSLFDLSRTIAGEIFVALKYPHMILGAIRTAIFEIGKKLDESEFFQVKEGVWIHRSATVFESAEIIAPCIVDEGAEVRHCAFIRGDAIIGRGAVVGNSTEIKNSVLFDGAQAPHYNYVGDSVLGYRSHLGAGAITSNLRLDRAPVFTGADREIETGKKKIGAFVGDYAEIGCGSVLSPGCVVGRGAVVYPLSFLRGSLGDDMIFKDRDNIVPKRKKS